MLPSRAATVLRGRDLAVGYVLVVLLGAAFVFTQEHAEQLVLDSSTNLQNLRNHPIPVLFVSAFVVSSPLSLWILPLLFWAYGSAQQWLGRAATVLVALFGHVFATVFVALLLQAAIVHNLLSRSVSRQPDVGVSYALAAVAGLLVFKLPVGRRGRPALLGTLALLGLIAASRTFTDLGHLIAWLVGLTMGLVGARIAAAAQR